MSWLKKVLGIAVEPTAKPAPQEEKTARKPLRIEELEERITPNALWGD